MSKITKSKLELTDPKLLKLLQERESEFVDLIIVVARKVEPIIEQHIPKVFTTYTLHDINHSLRIMEYMYDLITDHNNLSDLDITLLILSALLHDIGMAVFDDEKEKIITGENKYKNLSYNAILRKHNNDEEEALRELIRKVHGERTADFIKKELDGTLRIPSQPATTLTEDVATICMGHTESVNWLKSNLKNHSQKSEYSYSMLYCGMLLRLADILDFDSQRTPPYLYNFLKLNDVSNDEWLKHMDIANTEKVSTNKYNEKTIHFYGECSDSSIHRKILEYLEWVNIEIQNAIDLNSELNESYKFTLRYPLEDHIEPKGYKISNLKLSIDFSAISNLLMGENIYGSKKLGLRELIQNAIDACKVREEIEKLDDEYGVNDYQPKISVILDKENDEFIVMDNGVGMSFDILKNYFLNIGVSYYRSEDYILRDFKYKPIGKFGIGFLACFMLSNKVNIKTKHIHEGTINHLYLEKNSPYITYKDEELYNFSGTEIRLNYTELMYIFDDKLDNIKGFLEENFLTDIIDINVIEKGEQLLEIVNPLNFERKINENEYIIKLDKYLNDIEGQIIVEVKNKKHGSQIEDVPFMGEPYFYDGEKLIENVHISNLYDENNHCVNYLEIPVLSDDIYDEYQKYYDVLDDEIEVIERLEDKVNWITIFYNDNTELCFLEGDITLISEGDMIFEDFGFEDLISLGQDKYLPTCVYQVKHMLYYSSIEQLFISYYSEKHKKIYHRRSFLEKNHEDIYMKNVYVPRTSFYLDKMWGFIKLISYRINIQNEEVTTDVSRNKLDDESNKNLQYALNKCICLWVLDNLELNENEITLLNEFMDEFYSGKSSLVKKELFQSETKSVIL